MGYNTYPSDEPNDGNQAPDASVDEVTMFVHSSWVPVLEEGVTQSYLSCRTH